MSARRQLGASLAEAMAALALLGLVVTTCASTFFDASRLAARQDAAAERLAVAERLMERTLARRFEAQVPRAFGPGDAELDGRRDMRATVSVTLEAPGLKRVEVVVRDRGGRARLASLSAPWEGRQ